MLFSNSGRHSHKYVDKKQQIPIDPDADPNKNASISEQSDINDITTIDIEKEKTPGPRIAEKENRISRIRWGIVIALAVILSFLALLYAATDGFSLFSGENQNTGTPIAEKMEPEQLLADAAATDSGNLTPAIAVAINEEEVLYVADELAYDELIAAVKRNGTEQIEGKIISVSVQEDVEPVGVICRKNLVKSMEEALTYIYNKGHALQQYTAGQKEDLTEAALANKTSVERILALNKDLSAKSVLQKGQTIKVDSREHLLNLDIVAEIKEEKITEYQTEVQENAEWLKGTEMVIQEGLNGITEITKEQTYSKGVLTGEKIIEEKEVQEPVNEIIMVGTAEKVAKEDSEKNKTDAADDDSSVEED